MSTEATGSTASAPLRVNNEDTECTTLTANDDAEFDHVRPSRASLAGAKLFPCKLHHLLMVFEANGLSHIASFQPHGRAFKVNKLDLFVSQVLPIWSHQSKYSSFQRQLNIYGFKRLSYGPDKHAYYHESFLRGRPELTLSIPRVAIKGKGPRQAYSASVEPNFYSVPALGTRPASQPEPVCAVTNMSGHVLDHNQGSNHANACRDELLRASSRDFARASEPSAHTGALRRAVAGITRARAIDQVILDRLDETNSSLLQCALAGRVQYPNRFDLLSTMHPLNAIFLLQLGQPASFTSPQIPFSAPSRGVGIVDAFRRMPSNRGSTFIGSPNGQPLLLNMLNGSSIGTRSEMTANETRCNTYLHGGNGM